MQQSGRDYQLAPNQAGSFQRVYLEPLEMIPVAIGYPQGQPGDPVSVTAEDGGKIMTIGRAGVAAHSMANVAAVVELDERKQVAFEFQAPASRGIHRVVLRKGNDVKVLDFWVGEPLKVAGDKQ